MPYPHVTQLETRLRFDLVAPPGASPAPIPPSPTVAARAPVSTRQWRGTSGATAEPVPPIRGAGARPGRAPPRRARVSGPGEVSGRPPLHRDDRQRGRAPIHRAHPHGVHGRVKEIAANIASSGPVRARTEPWSYPGGSRRRRCRRAVGAAGARRPAALRLRLLGRRDPRQGRDARTPLAAGRARGTHRERSALRARVPRAAAPNARRASEAGRRDGARRARRALPADRRRRPVPPGGRHRGIPPLLTSGRAFAQATWRHALFGAALGLLAGRTAR